MLTNATLLQIDDPPPADPGPAISVRCTVGVPSASESMFAGSMGMSAAAILYLPIEAAAQVGTPTVGQHLTVRLDGRDAEVWNVLWSAARVGGTLSHVLVLLEAA